MSDLLNKTALLFFALLAVMGVIGLVLCIVDNFHLVIVLLFFIACIATVCFLLAVIWKVGETVFLKLKTKYRAKQLYIDGL
jgi:hypothetical protein